ncbi:glycine cleavage system regulatory protein [Agarivorans sp. OAG1]|jgi:glycine cleavage system regulatory protein|uniref:Glycine cleavage system transcriptional repressor n=1 Tax=Agarivorans albus MKT 106 TaxID=1331007 RepID=R9PTS7_AGAAL|nr:MULTISPECIES: ACT domain-containing protein [Agarivorans]MPW29105.1 ACT domain-containing protein [Agarivorans sp. B2Z047]UQN41658.1 ACT domain-containing protein [Agarivorans sp. B2Z047]BEU02365.1 glycine cleavage system regulatory protein [Agarivorans sp. OAG1]GAD02941.1 glycine cleavage system regulatory protein [Agarivorans albus MKT 106]
MSDLFLVTATGEDKPGTLNRLADITHSHQGKWLSSRVVNLDGQVACIFKVQVPQKNTQALQQALLAVDDLHLSINGCKPAHLSQSESLSLVIDAEDRPGLINDITRLLVGHGVNVNKLECHRMSVPEAGGSVFTAELDLMVPDSENTAGIIAEIEGLQSQMVVNQVH